MVDLQPKVNGHYQRSKLMAVYLLVVVYAVCHYILCFSSLIDQTKEFP